MRLDEQVLTLLTEGRVRFRELGSWLFLLDLGQLNVLIMIYLFYLLTDFLFSTSLQFRSYSGRFSALLVVQKVLGRSP